MHWAQDLNFGFVDLGYLYGFVLAALVKKEGLTPVERASHLHWGPSSAANPPPPSFQHLFTDSSLLAILGGQSINTCSEVVCFQAPPLFLFEAAHCKDATISVSPQMG